ncbi:MAG TPA: hypothetical protein VJK52_04700 [Candidatus Nanoarchaeia archaeon]|nr:hypothetical protein [Candidatus Nanoarchaeia archaeon]
MAWFHKTLSEAHKKAEQELTKPFEQQNWKEVFDILEEHVQVQRHEDQGLQRASLMINEYLKELSQLHGFISAIVQGKKVGVQGGTKTEMSIKFKKAVDSAEEFEQILLRLIKDERKLR